jgi:hypothetical protein
MNIDKGNQSTGGADMQVIGDFANGTSENIYVLKKLATSTPLMVEADAEGGIWIIVGTDSGFEATTTIYYDTIRIRVVRRLCADGDGPAAPPLRDRCRGG